jgi:hypothetical protein
MIGYPLGHTIFTCVACPPNRTTRIRRPREKVGFSSMGMIDVPCSDQRGTAVSQKHSRGCCRHWETNKGRTEVEPIDADGRRSFMYPRSKSIGHLSEDNRSLKLVEGGRGRGCACAVCTACICMARSVPCGIKRHDFRCSHIVRLFHVALVYSRCGKKKS